MVEVPQVEISSVLAESPFASPPHAVEIEGESAGGLRHRVRVEGQDGHQCMVNALSMLESCSKNQFAGRLARLPER